MFDSDIRRMSSSRVYSSPLALAEAIKTSFGERERWMWASIIEIIEGNGVPGTLNSIMALHETRPVQGRESGFKPERGGQAR